MGSASSVVKGAIQSSSSSLVGEMLARIATKKFIFVSFSAFSVPSTMVGKKQLVWSTENPADMKKVSLEMKLFSIRNLMDSGNSASFRKFVDENGHKDFVEKFLILEAIERKIFCRMFMVEYVPDEYHQLDDLVSLQEFLALDSSSSAPIHMVCEKLRKFVCNYQTSYERWMEILSSLQDELLAQLIGDYDEYMGCNDYADIKHKKEKLPETSSAATCHIEELLVANSNSPKHIESLTRGSSFTYNFARSLTRK